MRLCLLLLLQCSCLQVPNWLPVCTGAFAGVALNMRCPGLPGVGYLPSSSYGESGVLPDIGALLRWPDRLLRLQVARISQPCTSCCLSLFRSPAPCGEQDVTTLDTLLRTVNGQHPVVLFVTSCGGKLHGQAQLVAPAVTAML